MPETTDAAVFEEFEVLVAQMPAGSDGAVAAVRDRDNQLTKPAGALGKLEELVEFLARWQEKPVPSLNNPMVAVFAANHGVTAQKISAFPPEVTAQMVANFTNGGAAISQICALHEINLRVFELALDLPTGDISRQAAMDERTTAATLAYGMEAIAGQTDLLCIGEMGIGNTTVAAALCAAVFGGSGADWAGAGTGLDAQGVVHKAAIIDEALGLHMNDKPSPLEILARLGGREFAAMAGAIIAARHNKVPVIIDGFVATAAAAIVYAMNEKGLDHCLFGHRSAEAAHSKALKAMGKHPLLDLGMRLGEGSGAALAAVMVKTALRLHTGMATFQEATVSSKTDPV